MQNPFSWLFRQLFGKKQGPVIQKEVNAVVDPIALAVLAAHGLPTTTDGAKQAIASYALGKLSLSAEELAILNGIVNK